MRGIHINGHKDISKKNKIKEIKKIKKVFIPLIIGNDTNIIVKVKKNDRVSKGDIIALREGNFSLPIHASISGTITGFEERMCYNGTNVKCVVIENDGKDKTKESKEYDITKYSHKEFVSLLKDGGIRGLGGADFPTYIKYQTDEPINKLVINAVECEPYITADYALMREHYKEILLSIDAIMKINNISNGYIAIKKYNKDIIELFNKNLSKYPNIKIVSIPDIYPMGWEKNTIEYITHKKYNKLPIEINTVVNNVSTVYAIYKLLKYHEPLISRVLTVTGEMVKKPLNVEVRIGTPLKDLIDVLSIKKGNKFYVIGGPMMGINVPSDDVVSSSSLNSVLVLNEPNLGTEEQCLRCGKCVKVCPAKLSPVLIKDNVNNIDKLNFLEVNRCIECGLCSYICPAKINVREYVRKAKNEVRKKR